MSRMSGCSSGGSSPSSASVSSSGCGAVAGAGASSSADNTLSSLSGKSSSTKAPPTPGPLENLFIDDPKSVAPPPPPVFVTSIMSTPGGHHAGRTANHVTIADTIPAGGPVEDGRRSARARGSAPMVEQPRKTSLFSNFKLKSSKKESLSPREPPTAGALTSTVASAALNRQYLTVGPGASTSFGVYRDQQSSSPRLFSNILDHFRKNANKNESGANKSSSSTSKKKFIVKPVSENEHKSQVLTRVKGTKMTAEEIRREKMASDMLSVYATIHGGRMRPPMTTIPSVDEDTKMESCALPAPLFVDTRLANHEAAAAASSTSGWRQKAHSLSARSALGSLGFGRHHKDKEKEHLQQQQHDHRKRSVSGNEGQYTDTRHRMPYHKHSSPVPHSSSSAHSSPFRPQRSLDSSAAESYPASRIYFSSSPNESGDGAGFFDVINDNADQLFYNLLFTHLCQVLPLSGKVVVFDVNLPVKKAFYALVYNSVRAATLVDEQQRFVGMLTITDFIQILHHYESHGRNFIEELEHNTIKDWKKTQAGDDRRWQKFLYIDINQNLHRAVRQLLTHKIHRLAIVCPHTHNMLYVLTLKRILRYLSIYLVKTPHKLLPSYVQQTPKSLNIGTYEDLITVTYQTPLRRALSLFLERKVSALPILDDNDRVRDIYCKFDVINLVANNAFSNLDLTLGEALRHRRRSAPMTIADPDVPSTSKASPNAGSTNVISCAPGDSLWRVITTLTQNEIHRVPILDENLHLRGIVSLSDIFNYLKEPLKAVSPGHATRAATDPTTAGDMWADISSSEQQPESMATSQLLQQMSTTPPSNLIHDQIMEEVFPLQQSPQPSSPQRPGASS